MRPAAVMLELQDVSVDYGANRVLDHLSLSAAGGEFIALLGASGCGKTTLLRAICGFVPLAGGSITVRGRDISRLPPDKRNVAMVFQSYALWPHMTVAQNIGYGLKLRHIGHSEIARRIAEMLAMLRLDGLGDRKVTALSGGQRQRVALGRALAVNHQKAAGEMVPKGLLARYAPDVPTAKLVTSEAARRALGANVDGYVMPMFNSQTAIAYNAEMVKDPPATYAALEKWVEQNPKKFGYNGIKGGMSGVSFVVGWIYANTPDAQRLINGPYDPAIKATWDQALARLAAFNRNVVLTPGNAGTLDMLSRGEIAMGPVWVDMFYTWQAEGKIPPTVKLKLIGPGMPGQPMYYVVPAKAANAKLAEEFIGLATSPKVQAEGIVERFNWYPGIDAAAVKSQLDDATWQKLFVDVTPEDLASKGKPFPIAPYFNDILESYERKVQ